MLLGIIGETNFPRDLIWGVSENGIEVVCGSRIVSCDVFAAFEGYRGEEAVSTEVSLE